MVDSRLDGELRRLGIQYERIVEIPEGFRCFTRVTPVSKEVAEQPQDTGIERRNGGPLEGVAFYLPSNWDWRMEEDSSGLMCLIPLVRERYLNKTTGYTRKGVNIFTV